MENVFNEIREERQRQDEKWGVQNHNPFIWLGIIGEEQGEVCHAVLEKDWDNYREELIQVAAVAVSMIQCYDRNVIEQRLSDIKTSDEP